MKQIIIAALGLATLLSMSGCTSIKSFAETLQPVSIASMENETFEITSTTTSEEQAKETGATLKIDITDAVNRTFKRGDEQYSFKIPKITISGVNTDEVNEKIRKDIEKTFYEGDSKEGYDSKYQFFVNNNLVSILVSNVDLFGGEFENIKVYNIDAATGKFVKGNEIVKLAGMTDDSFFAKVRELYVKFNNLQLTLEGLDEVDKIALEENFAQISYDFIQPYIGSNGKLSFIGDVFCTGGSGVSFERFQVD
ncbi:MAG: hypothetical protein K6D93_00120 [Saccharofermentans sp.]|nr:hypothetical protein [Saccharofermentans sp.]